MFTESLPSSTNRNKTQLTLFFSFRTALLFTQLNLVNLSLIVSGQFLKSHNPVYYATGIVVLKCVCIPLKGSLHRALIVPKRQRRNGGNNN